MTVAETSSQMWDSSEDISDAPCLPVYGAAEYKVYTGTGWSAMRYVSLQEPGEDPRTSPSNPSSRCATKIGRASCRERVL